MVTRLTERLERAIAKAEKPLEQELLKAERVAALVRHGRMGDAKFALSGVRAQSVRLRDPLLTAWVHFDAGLLEYMSGGREDLAAASKKLERAHALARASGDDVMQARIAAWLASIEFNERDFAGAGAHLREAFALAAPAPADIATRVLLTLADLCMTADDADEANRYYTEVRQRAVEAGDTGTIAQMMLNRVSLMVYSATLAAATGEDRADECRRLLLESESVANYLAGIRSSVSIQIPRQLTGMLHLALGQWHEAVAILDSGADGATPSGIYWGGRLHAERGWALWNSGQRERGWREMAQGEKLARKLACDPDDLALIQLRMAAVHAAAGRVDDAEAMRVAARASIAEFRERQATLLKIARNVAASRRSDW